MAPTLSPLIQALALVAPLVHPALRATRRKPLLQNLQMPALMPQHRLAPMTLTGNLTTKLTFHKLTPTSMTSTTLQRLPLALTQAAKPKVMLSLLLDLVPAAKEEVMLNLVQPADLPLAATPKEALSLPLAADLVPAAKAEVMLSLVQLADLVLAATPKVMPSLPLDLAQAAKAEVALEAALAADLAVALAAKVRDAHAPLKLTSMMMTMDWPRSMPTLKPKRDLWLT